MLQHPVTLVAAPAGFGKTTTLAIWEAKVRDRLAVAWLSLGSGDNDPVRFWTSTVKSNVHHLIDMLGVASRAEALVRARELGAMEAVSRPGGAG